MKKIKNALGYFLVLAMLLTLAACGAEMPPAADTGNMDTASTDDATATTTTDKPITAKNFDLSESDGIVVGGLGVLVRGEDVELTPQGLKITSGYTRENGPITATRPDGTTIETTVEYKRYGETVAPYMEAAVVATSDWTLERLVELYYNGEAWLRPAGFCTSFVFSSDGQHYAQVADADGVIDDYRMGWMQIDREYVWNVSNLPRIDDLSAVNLAYLYQSGEWDGSPVWSLERMQSAWISQMGELVYCNPDQWWGEWTDIYPAAGTAPADYGFMAGGYTIVVRGNYLEAYRRDGTSLGAHRTPQPKGGRRLTSCQFLWSEDIYAEHPEYDPIVYLDGAFYRVALDGSGVTRVFDDWLTKKVGPGEAEVLYLDGDDLRLFSIVEGDQLIAANCSLAEARHYVPLLDQKKAYSAHGDRIANSYFDPELAIVAEDGTADVLTLANQVLASQY